MDFRFLGPLEVRSAGALLPLGGEKQRGLLAVLLLHANEVVSVDRLVEDVWGEAPPRTVQAYVQNCVSRLRTVLGREVIETHSAGYLLRVDPADVDALSFARAVEAARTLETPERVAALNEALALWRGTPLAEFAYEPFAQSEIARLEELRLEAVEGRLAAELELGHHADVLPELEALATRHPSRERLRYLQMLALYRSGRQRDALAAYQEARRELVERYGLEPGEDLRALERMILAQDPALREHPQTEGGGAPVSTCVMLVVEPAVEGGEDIVERTGGVVRASESGLVAAYGVPHSQDGDALRALRAASELHATAARARIAVDRVQGTEPHLFDRRLLEEAAAGETIVGAQVLPLIAHAVDVLAHASGGFRLLAFDADAEALPRRFDTPFIAREAELDRLGAELEATVEAGTPRRLLILGDAGIGKTRLAREFAAQAHAVVVTVRCRPDAEVDTIAELLPQLEPLEQLLALEPDGERIVTAVHGPSGPTEKQWALRRLLESAARVKPLLLVIDDLQWATSRLLDSTDYLVGWARAPLFLLGLGRPEMAEARAGLDAKTLFLERLSVSDAHSLAHALRADVLDSVVGAAEGNPLYIEQLVASSNESDEGRLPPTVDALIAMRIERLPEAERRVLEHASVVGPEFWRSAVEAASPGSDIAPALMSLVRRRLVHPAIAPVEGEDGFRFHHALIRDVVYRGVPPAERARVHAAIAHSLGPEPEYDALAGHHLEQAASGDPALAEEGGRRLGAAGLRAVRRLDATRAVDLLGRATALAPEGPRHRELACAFAAATKFAGDPTRADGLLDAVAAESLAAGDEANALRARVEQVWPRLSRGSIDVDEALELLEHAVGVFGTLGDHYALARAWDLIAAVNGAYLLQLKRCVEAGLRARGHYERSDSTTGGSDARLAAAAYLGPTPASEAIAQCESLLAEAETPVWASFVLPFLAGLHAMEGRFALARSQLETARDGRAEFADPSTLATSWAALAAEVEIRAGDLNRAEGILVDACDHLRAIGETEWLAINTALLGEIQAEQGRHDEALAAADAALATLPSGHLDGRSFAERTRARALIGAGRNDEAVVAARELVAALGQTDALVEQGRALATLADALGTDPEADVCRHAAVAVLEQKGDLVTARAVAARGRVSERPRP